VAIDAEPRPAEARSQLFAEGRSRRVEALAMMGWVAARLLWKKLELVAGFYPVLMLWLGSVQLPSSPNGDAARQGELDSH
jgi:hypothetical protein